MEQLLNVREVAKLVKTSERTIWHYSKTGRMPVPVRLGRSVRWRQADIDEWINKGCLDCQEVTP